MLWVLFDQHLSTDEQDCQATEVVNLANFYRLGNDHDSRSISDQAHHEERFFVGQSVCYITVFPLGSRFVDVPCCSAAGTYPRL